MPFSVSTLYPFPWTWEALVPQLLFLSSVLQLLGTPPCRPFSFRFPVLPNQLPSIHLLSLFQNLVDISHLLVSFSVFLFICAYSFKKILSLLFFWAIWQKLRNLGFPFVLVTQHSVASTCPALSPKLRGILQQIPCLICLYLPRAWDIVGSLMFVEWMNK